MSPEEPFTASKAEVQQLIQRMVSLQDKWPSEPTLTHLTPRMVNGLLVYTGQLECGSPLLRIALGVFCGVMFLLWANQALFPLYLLAPPLCVLAELNLMCAWVNRCDPWNQRCAVYALTQSEDLRVLPILIKATDNEWGRHAEVLNAIRRLLPQVTEEHIGLLKPDIQVKLWYLAVPPVTLEAGGNEDLARGAVQALARIGNDEALTRMQRTVHVSAVYPAHRRIQEFMKPYIPVMEARLQQQQLPQTLLRPSDASASTSDILLRAAHVSNPEPPQQLLRASTSKHPDADI